MQSFYTLPVLLIVTLMTFSSFQRESMANEGQGCTITASPLAFGRYDALASIPLDSTAAVTYRCAGHNSHRGILTIMMGTGGAPSFQSRRLMGTQDSLAYNIYVDAGRSVIWGDGSHGTGVYTAPYSHQSISVPLYGRIPTGQSVVPGHYSNTLVVTIHF